MRYRQRQLAMAEAAMSYAARGWPVAPAVEGAVPAVPRATTDPSTAAGWWKTFPRAAILLATGGPVDALDVPASVGSAALTRLREVGLPVGPIATMRDRYLFLVAGGQRDRFMTHRERLGAPHLDIAYHGEGNVVLLPPSSWDGESARWEVCPDSCILSRGHSLPSAAELHGTIAYVALREALPT